MVIFKIGDTVECIKNTLDKRDGSRWKLGDTFVITDITNSHEYKDSLLLWDDRAAIYEHSAKLVTQKEVNLLEELSIIY